MSNPSLLCVPYRFKTSKLYSQIPDSGLGDFTVTRATTPTAGRATRINAAGFIQLVADNVPRLDYPLGGITAGCPSLLVEPSAQNLALQSEDFGTTWNPANMLAFGSGSVLNTTATLDPYGTNVADFIVGNTTVGQHRFDQTTTSVSGSYTLSAFVKAGGYSFTRLRIGLAGAVFDLSSGVVVTTDAGITSSIQSFGNGWFRCIIGKAASAANEIIRINMQSTSSTADFAGDGTSGIYVFGAQYEAGSVATSYIPTTTAAITRGAETVSKTGVSSLIGQTEGTLYIEYNMRTLGVEGYAIRLVAASFDNSVHIRRSTANLVTLELRSAGSTVFSQTFSATGFVKAAIAYKSGDIAAFVNGTQAGSTSTSAFTFGASFTSVNLGTFGAASFLNDRIRAAAIYPTRLTNAQLQSLTQ